MSYMEKQSSSNAVQKSVWKKDVTLFLQNDPKYLEY